MRRVRKGRGRTHPPQMPPSPRFKERKGKKTKKRGPYGLFVERSTSRGRASRSESPNKSPNRRGVRGERVRDKTAAGRCALAVQQIRQQYSKIFFFSAAHRAAGHDVFSERTNTPTRPGGVALKGQASRRERTKTRSQDFPRGGGKGWRASIRNSAPSDSQLIEG